MKRCVGLRFLVFCHLPVDPVEHNRAIFGEIELHGLARQKGLSLRQFGGHLRQIHFSLLLYLPRLRQVVRAARIGLVHSQRKSGRKSPFKRRVWDRQRLRQATSPRLERAPAGGGDRTDRSEEHTSELQSLLSHTYAVL